MIGPDGFDDYLDLAATDLAGVHVVTFHGRSGSGKSSAVTFLRERHPAFRERRGEPLAVLDDLRSPRGVLEVAARLRSGHRVLAACHFHPRWLLPLRAPWRIASFDLDPRPEKIERWLAGRRIPFTSGAVDAFCRRFGANYTDAGLVLEYAPGRSFDAALARFLRECRVEHTDRPQAGSRGGTSLRR